MEITKILYHRLCTSVNRGRNILKISQSAKWQTRDGLQDSLGIGLLRLSMGMSGDYEVAVEEGATWVRLGTVLFGERPKAKPVRAESDGDAGTFSAGLDSYSGAGPTFKVLD